MQKVGHCSARGVTCSSLGPCASAHLAAETQLRGLLPMHWQSFSELAGETMGRRSDEQPSTPPAPSEL